MPDSASSPTEEQAGSPAGGRRAIVTGATGLVGHYLLPRLAAAGWEVEAISRREAPRVLPAAVRWHVLDMGHGLGALRGEAVFHAAPLPLLPALVPELARQGVRRLVAFGSTSRFTKLGATSAASRAMARALTQAEEDVVAACEAHGLAWTVFRPTLIHGAGRDRNVSSVARFIRRFGFFPLVGAAHGLRQPVHADDLAQACLQAVDAPATLGHSYNLPGGSMLPYREMAVQLFAALGRRPRFVRLPLGVMRVGLALAGHLPGLGHLSPDMADRMQRDQAFDAAPARRDFGYEPRAFDAAAVVADIGG